MAWYTQERISPGWRFVLGRQEVTGMLESTQCALPVRLRVQLRIPRGSSPCFGLIVVVSKLSDCGTGSVRPG